ncbi:acyltransferase [Rhizobium sp. RM]|uniref:acyltransferase family protein n=1 Tax=Rhizobium sp. RM TaxID=2748079 RepID=UPI00110D5ACE|nr:acyltransferase [Rhizobium sp. RM]NWJ24960.1 acyltransferase [Rhizobium sp. RM]TMV16741.1 acyltransferase [Rhizobium sp. Td3]
MKRIDQLEGLRGLLAAWVVVVHLLPAAGIDPDAMGVFKPLINEKIRVQIFCIMSGFVIFVMMSSLSEDYTTYISRRLKRIYPAYIFAFVLSIAFAWIAYEALTEADFQSARNAGRIAILNNSFADWEWNSLAHVTMLHGVVPDSWLPLGAYAFLGQAWNISTEFQFYVIAPIVFWFLHHQSKPLRIAFTVFTVVAVWYLKRWPNAAILANYAIYFALGIASYYLWNMRWKNQPLLSPLIVIPLAAVVGWFDLAMGAWIFIFGGALMVRDKKRQKGPVTRFLEHPAMTFLGTVSYPLYLLHMIPLYGWMYVLNNQGLDQATYFALLATLTFATAIPFAYLTQKYVEAPFYRSRTHKMRPVTTTDVRARSSNTVE